MIPEKPRQFDPSSLEGIMFEALENLTDDYYVFHSFRITDTEKNILHESETDFVIFNRNKGVLSIEAKAGQVRYDNGVWLYGSGIPMHNGGPFVQAASNKYKLMSYISKSKMPQILDKCKFIHAVWFPSINENSLRGINLPSEADKKILLPSNALSDIENYISRIFDLEIEKRIKTDLNDSEVKYLIQRIFCPRFSIVPTGSFENDLKRIAFHRLLKEQTAILDFLDEQKTGAINGAAGTGKTLIAVEKATRHAASGERVLFLCFNAMLRDHLERTYANPLISFQTVAGFACSICHTSKPDYSKAKNRLEDMYISSSFPFKHVIVDEGQDFGKNRIEESDILELIKLNAVESNLRGSFYIFYDKYQLVQSNSIPMIIEEMDCRLTLHKNCRNTENIAVTSFRPISEIIPDVMKDGVKGQPVRIYYVDNPELQSGVVDEIINRIADSGIDNPVILTTKTEYDSSLSDEIINGKYKNKYLFTTCRKYKGLEADSVILTDVDMETFDANNMLFYVGSSRARLRLDIITTISDDECIKVLKDVFKIDRKKGSGRKRLASTLKTISRVIN